MISLGRFGNQTQSLGGMLRPITALYLLNPIARLYSVKGMPHALLT